MKKIHHYLDGVREKEKLAPHTTLKIGGEAEFFYDASTSGDLLYAVKIASYLGAPYEILAGGSNVLVSDKGFGGLVIKVKSNKLNFEGDAIEVESGASLPLVMAKTSLKGFSGLEWSAGIPGTIGGALFGNAGSFGMSISDIVESVDIYDPERDEAKTLSKKDCGFDYRNSNFKKSNLVILRCKLNLKKGDKENISETIKNNLRYKRENHPIGILSAGCVFKNVNKKSIKDDSCFTREISGKFNSLGYIPAGLLIEMAGFRGYDIGDVMVSKKHANFILNKKGARAEQMIYLINQIKRKIKDQFGVVLEEEIRYIGFKI